MFALAHVSYLSVFTVCGVEHTHGGHGPHTFWLTVWTTCVEVMLMWMRCKLLWMPTYTFVSLWLATCCVSLLPPSLVAIMTRFAFRQYLFIVRACLVSAMMINTHTLAVRSLFIHCSGFRSDPVSPHPVCDWTEWQFMDGMGRSCI